MDSSFSILYDPSEDAAIHWAARTGLEHALDLRTAEQLYARALPYLKNWAWALATKHGWKQEAVDTVGDMPLAICLGRDELLQSSDSDFSYVARLVLPTNFSDLLNPEFTNDWAAMFSRLTTSSSSSPDPADIFQLGRAGIPRPLQNILYLLQILSPGLLVIKSVATDDEEEGEWGTQDIDLIALPPSIWVGLHIEDLEDIFGAQTAVKLYQAAEDPYCASEDANSASSYSNYDTSSNSSYSAFNNDNFDDEWPEFDEPNYDDQDDQDGVLPQFAQHYAEEAAFDYHDTHILPDVVEPDDFSAQDYHLISVPSNGKASNLMDYRHCEEDGCMTCSQRFAQNLTERLLMYSALLAH